MRRAAGLLLIALSACPALAADRPNWAFPTADKIQPPSRDDGKPKTAPGSPLALTRAQIDNPYNPPDWFPDIHPPMPGVVA